MDNLALSDGVRMNEVDTTLRTSPNYCGRLTKIERSCLVCHQRKIRCDKRSPCSNCVRGDVLCRFPKEERGPRRPNKTTISDVSDRLALLERAVKAISNGASKTPRKSKLQGEAEAPKLSEATSSVQIAEDKERTKKDRLLQDGNSNLYINEVQLSKILDEQKELRAIIGTPRDRNTEAGNTSIDIGPLFSGFGGSSNFTKQLQHPSRLQAIQLWRRFVNNVDPIVKVLHVPTTETFFFASISRPQDRSYDLQALLFSIYFASVTSSTPLDVSTIFGLDKAIVLSRFKENLERCLAASDLLETPTIKSLQAMVIYLICSRVHNTGRSIWTLSGLTIRAAQSIGLHRDGTGFKLTPFETEMRRRLWWSLCNADSRAAEDHGIFVEDRMAFSDTLLPLNIDDRDLSPDMETLPASKPGWTEMTLHLIMIQTGQLMKRFGNVGVGGPDDEPQSSAAKTVEDYIEDIETTHLQYCDLNIPIQRVTALMTRVVAKKVLFKVHQHCHSDSEQASWSEKWLSSACEILVSMASLQQDELLSDWRWLFESFTQYYLLTFILYTICTSPPSPNIDLAWNVVENYLEVFDYRKMSGRAGTKWALLRYLREKAVKTRGIQQSPNTANATVGEAVGKLNTKPYERNAVGAPEGLDFDGQDMDWDIGTVGYMDWTNFVENFDMRGLEL